MQLKRFQERRRNPLKIWKLSTVYLAAMTQGEVYGEGRNDPIATTRSATTPWTVVRASDKRRARLNITRHLPAAIEYPGRAADAVGRVDPSILGGPQPLTDLE